ncbi:MAG: reverse transcriptase domain-containing protein [Mobilitalea sp.]
MSYMLNDNILIKRPIIFLCGPYYNENNKSDRRRIFKEYFLHEYKDKCLPLIIDDFLTKKNIADETISIQLLEEIFAGISYKTYVFLDTMSAAVELGLFSNSAFNNSLYVMLPQEKDILTGGVGYFIKDIVLKDNPQKINTTRYRPKIDRVAYSSDCITEYYNFVDDKIPEHIRFEIQDDFNNNLFHEKEIEIEENDAYPRKNFCLNYKYDSDHNTLKLYISVQFLFYIVGGVLYAEYSELLRKKKDLDFDHFNVDWAVNNLKSILLAYMQKHTFIGINNKTNIEMFTVLVQSINEIVKHIVTFIFTYHKNGRLNGYFLIGKNDIVRSYQYKAYPIDVFKLSSVEVALIKAINYNHDQFYRSFTIKTGNKKRDIVTYLENENGNNVRALHEKIVKVLDKSHNYHKNSFAYQKGKSVKDCAEQHKGSFSFLKYDIHKFFNSIDKNVLLDIILEKLQVDASSAHHLNLIFDICFFDKKMPLGLTSSPILSDIYLNSFDQLITSEMFEFGYIYTRYADDILISSTEEITEVRADEITSLIVKELKAKKLTLNTKKSKKINLKSNGQHIKYLGMNIVKMQDSNVLTVGKDYKNYIAKCYLKFLDINDGTDDKFYFEGEKGLKQIFMRIEKSTNGRVIIKNRIENL